MKKFNCISFLVFVLSFVLISTGNSQTKIKETKLDTGDLKGKEFNIKFATLAPKGTTATQAVDMMQGNFDFLEKRFGFRVTLTSYYGGVMGDDPQMIQKAQMGQLDMLATTLMGITNITKDIDVFNMAYLIENFGQFDYILSKNSKYINDIFYKKKWISLSLITSEGQHDIYMPKPYKKPEEMKAKLVATNYTGGPDDTFYKAMGIPQIPVAPTSFYPAVKAGTCNSGIIPSAFVIGMQIYSSLPYFIDPPVRISTSAILLTKQKWEKLPWDFRIYLAGAQPLMYYFTGGLMRDAAYAYSTALQNHGCQKVKLTPEELQTWKNYVIPYRKTYLDNNPELKETYNRIIKSIEEYNNSYPIERAIYESDPTYKNFPDKLIRIGNAVELYQKTGNKTEILKLDKDKIMEKWRLYDMIEACEEYIKTNNTKKLYNWYKSFYISDIVEEMFTKHQDSLKRLYGSKEALRDRVEEGALVYKLSGNKYLGYQRVAEKQKTK